MGGGRRPAGAVQTWPRFGVRAPRPPRRSAGIAPSDDSPMEGRAACHAEKPRGCTRQRSPTLMSRFSRMVAVFGLVTASGLTVATVTPTHPAAAAEPPAPPAPPPIIKLFDLVQDPVLHIPLPQPYPAETQAALTAFETKAVSRGATEQVAPTERRAERPGARPRRHPHPALGRPRGHHAQAGREQNGDGGTRPRVVLDHGATHADRRCKGRCG